VRVCTSRSSTISPGFWVTPWRAPEACTSAGHAASATTLATRNIPRFVLLSMPLSRYVWGGRTQLSCQLREALKQRDSGWKQGTGWMPTVTHGLKAERA